MCFLCGIQHPNRNLLNFSIVTYLSCDVSAQSQKLCRISVHKAYRVRYVGYLKFTFDHQREFFFVWNCKKTNKQMLKKILTFYKRVLIIFRFLHTHTPRRK